MYNKFLLKHYHSPVNIGTLENYNFISELTNFSCSDKIIFQAQIESDVFKKIAFNGQGCILSQATASILTEYILDKDLKFVEDITQETILKLIQVDLGPMRLKCAMLSLEAIKLGIRQYKQ